MISNKTLIIIFWILFLCIFYFNKKNFLSLSNFTDLKFYDDTDMSYEDLDTLNYTTIANKYVKVVIKSKENPLLFDSYISRLEEQEPINLQVVEDHLNLDLEDDDDIIDEAEDTLTILDGYIEGLDIKTGKPQLKSLMHNLYNEALSIV